MRSIDEYVTNASDYSELTNDEAPPLFENEGLFILIFHISPIMRAISMKMITPSAMIPAVRPEVSTLQG